MRSWERGSGFGEEFDVVSKGEESEQEEAREQERAKNDSLLAFFRARLATKATSIVAPIRSRLRSFLFGAVQMTKDTREHGWQRGQSSGTATAGAAPISESEGTASGNRDRRPGAAAAANLMTFSSEGKEALSPLPSFVFLSNVPAVSEDRALNVKPVLWERKVWERRRRRKRADE